MNVLHIGTELQWRGGENQVLLLSQYLKVEKIKFVMAYPKKSKALKIFEQNGFEILPLNSKGGYQLFDAMKILNYCVHNKVDIIHVHSGRAHSLGYLVKLLGGKSKLIVHRRVAFPIKKSFLTKKKYYSKWVDKFISISDAIKTALIEYGVSSDKIIVAKSSVEGKKNNSLNKLECRKKFNIPADSKAIGILAALTEEKGHETLLEALNNFNEDYVCLFAGAGKEEYKLKKMIKELGLEAKVIFLGFIENPEELLIALDVLIVPSFSEGLGSIAIDGMLAGNIVIGTNVGGLPEVIIDLKTGYLFEPGDFKKLKSLLAMVLKQDNRKMIEQAKKHIDENFSIAIMAQKTLATYKEVIQ